VHLAWRPAHRRPPLLALVGAGTYSYYQTGRCERRHAGVVHTWWRDEADDRVFVMCRNPFHYYAARIPAPTRYLFVDVHTAAAT